VENKTNPRLGPTAVPGNEPCLGIKHHYELNPSYLDRIEDSPGREEEWDTCVFFFFFLFFLVSMIFVCGYYSEPHHVFNTVVCNYTAGSIKISNNLHRLDRQP